MPFWLKPVHIWPEVAGFIRFALQFLVRYERVLERVAQNAFDGLSLVRNEQIAKVQGLEANPLDSPIYYDGTSKQFGGSQMTSLYNTTETYKERASAQNQARGGGASSAGGNTY